MNCKKCGRPVTLVQLPSGKHITVNQTMTNHGTRYRVYEHKDATSEAIRSRHQIGFQLHEETCRGG